MVSSERDGVLGWARSQLTVHAEKIRYLIVGVWNTIFGYLLFLVLLATIGSALHSLADSSSRLLALVGRNYYLVASWIGWIVAVPQSTITMKYLVFRSPGRLLPQIGRAFFIYLPAQALGSVLLWITVRLIGLPPWLGAIVTIGITTVISYLGHKYFTFRLPLEMGEVAEEELLEGDAIGEGRT